MPPPAPVPITTTSNTFTRSPLRRRQMDVGAIIDVRTRGRRAVVTQRGVVELAISDLARIETHQREIAHAPEEFLAGFVTLAIFRAVRERLEQCCLRGLVELEKRT